MIKWNDTDTLVGTGKAARSESNAERHQALNGKTVKDVLGRDYTKTDLRYDLKLGFLVTEVAKSKKAAA